MVRRATAALIPLVTSLLQVNALIFELVRMTRYGGRPRLILRPAALPYA